MASTVDTWPRDTWHQEATWPPGEEMACSIREMIRPRTRLYQANWTRLSSELTHTISRSPTLKMSTLKPKWLLLRVLSTRNRSDRTRFWSYRRKETAQETTSCTCNSHCRSRIQRSLRISKRNKTQATANLRSKSRTRKISRSSTLTSSEKYERM